MLVVGTSCSGKSIFASRLAKAVEAPYVELDALFWLADWQERSADEFLEGVATATSGKTWVVDGNYRRRLEDLLWPAASGVVWLDYSFPLTFARALRRTLRRVATGERLFAGNFETFGRAFLSRESILWWVVQSHLANRVALGARRREDREKQAERRWWVFRHPREAEYWLREVESARALRHVHHPESA